MWDCQQLIGLEVAATDGQIGRLEDLCFDDERWLIRYLIVNTSSAARPPEVALGLEQSLKDMTSVAAGGLSLDAWSLGTATATADRTPQSHQAARSRPSSTEMPPENQSPLEPPANGSGRLRRVEEVRGYRVRAIDGDVGHVDGFLIDESSWSIEYVIVETTIDGATRRVVAVPTWISQIDRARCSMQLEVSRRAILTGPEFTEDIQQGYESWLWNQLARASAGSMH